MTFPISRKSYRTFSSDWQGDVITCDIDRTYLMTRFSSLKGIAKIPFEFAIDKKDIAGMATLLRELRRGPDTVSRHTPIYFLSASPSQLRPVIERKMMLDGIEYDGTTFKDWKKIIFSRRLGRLHDQLGFKVTALLRARRQLPPGATEVLIGDDLEADAVAFALYADLLAGRIPEEVARALITREGATKQVADEILQLASQVATPGAVRSVYLRLERCEPAALMDFFPSLLPTRGAFQMALSMRHQALITSEGVVRVARDVANRGVASSDLGLQLADAVKRCLVPIGLAQDVVQSLRGARLIPHEIAFSDPDPAWAKATAQPRERWLPQAYGGHS